MRKALIEKNKNRKKTAIKQFSAGNKVEFSTKVYNVCEKCHRNGSYMRRFKLCRICFRELASDGKIPGVRKSSW